MDLSRNVNSLDWKIHINHVNISYILGSPKLSQAELHDKQGETEKAGFVQSEANGDLTAAPNYTIVQCRGDQARLLRSGQ